MQVKTTAFLGLTLLLLLAGLVAAPTTYAAGDEYKTKFDAGKAELEFDDGQLELEMDIKGLAAGHVFSVWLFVNNDAPINRGGFETNGNGKAEFEADIVVGEDFELTGFSFKIKDHGLPIPGHIDEQKSTKGFGCDGSCPTVASGAFKIS